MLRLLTCWCHVHARVAGKENKIIVVVGTVLDDARLIKFSKLTIAALHFSAGTNSHRRTHTSLVLCVPCCVMSYRMCRVLSFVSSVPCHVMPCDVL